MKVLADVLEEEVAYNIYVVDKVKEFTKHPHVIFRDFILHLPSGRQSHYCHNPNSERRGIKEEDIRPNEETEEGFTGIGPSAVIFAFEEIVETILDMGNYSPSLKSDMPKTRIVSGKQKFVKYALQDAQVNLLSNMLNRAYAARNTEVAAQ
jgi:hypothetical protein